MIRVMRPDDLSGLLDIWLAANLAAHGFIPAAYWQSNLAATAEGIAEAEVWVYEDDGKPAGFIGLCEDYIAGVFVAEQYRSRGIGKKLLNTAKTRHNKLRLSVYAKNRRACAFYLREGFKQTKQQIDNDTNETEYILEWQK